ncbi:sensor histidine kinase [Plantactinospora sp. GCM10030261]|uniref:sensor histidine kinase n=1 Tax=Plantactinospora sp. GCM10030261 TaxID=3273420 RepID=UPI003612F9EA
MTGAALWRRTWVRDAGLAAASYAGGLLLLAVGADWRLDPDAPEPTAWSAVTLLATCVAVALRRVASRGSLALGTVAVAVDQIFCGSLATVLVYTQVLYDACVYGSPRTWRWLLRVTIGLTVLSAAAGVLVTGRWSGVAFGVIVVLAGLLPVLTGISVRQYRDQAAAARAQSEQTARLVELDRSQAVTAERHRMARELHDVVANHLSAVALHATAVLSVRDLDQAQVDQALRVIRENSVRGLTEMRQMIGLLRDPGNQATGRESGELASGEEPGVEPATRVSLADLDELLERSRAAGLAIRADITGEARELPVGVDLAAYRIVQESLTNALKHGHGEVALIVGYQPDRVTVTVENPLPTEPVPSAVPGAGAGLIGMRERAALVAGRFEAGPADRRWRVRAELPTTEEVLAG